jgi:DNA-binding response OmpR family regulator
MSRALIIDDEIDICLMISRHLQHLKFETQYALTVKEARLKLLSSTYDIVFLDLNLTDGSGFDVIHYKNKLNLDAKIVVISAYDSESNKALQAGASLFLAKPFALRSINESLKALDFLPSNLPNNLTA